MSSKDDITAPSETKTPRNWQETLKNKSLYCMHVSLRILTWCTVPSKHTDPCLAASTASMKCLDNNDYNRDECLEYFKAYRECKSQWYVTGNICVHLTDNEYRLKQRRADRRAGVANV